MSEFRRGGTNMGGRALRKVASLAILAALLAMPMALPVGAEDGETRTGLPDFEVEALFNYLDVVAGELAWFNLTIHNAGDAAYLVRSSGDLEIYAYKDDETQVTFFQRIYEDIYVNESYIFDFQMKFDTTGLHSLSIFIDQSDRVEESNEDNNKATVEFEVIPRQTNKAPQADGGNDRTGYVGKPMLFSAQHSSDPDDDPLTYNWVFGDGDTDTGIRVHHAYQELGDYRAVLTVSDGYLTDEDIFTVHIIEAPSNLPPVPVITVATTIVMVDEVLELDGEANTIDPEGDDLQFDWDFDSTDGVNDWVIGPAVTHSWDKAGKYTVTLRVTDGVSTVDTTKRIEVTAPEPVNLIPSAYAGADVVLKKGDSWTFLGTGTDSDGHVVAYEWDLDGNGAFDTYSDSDGNLNYVFTEVGYRTLRFRVTDDRGGMGFDTVTVTVLDPKADDNSTPGMPSFIVIMIICLAAVLAKRGEIRVTGSRTETEKEELSFK